MALSDLLAEIGAVMTPAPGSDRGVLVLLLLACGCLTALHVACPHLVAKGVVPADWTPRVMAGLVLVSAAALVLGAAHLIRRTSGIVLPVACSVMGGAGCGAAWWF